LAGNVDRLQIDPDRIEQADVSAGKAEKVLASLLNPSRNPG